MKKFLSALLAGMLVMCTSVTAFGATANDVKKQMTTAVQYLYGEKESFSAEEAKDFYLYLTSGSDAAHYKEAWCDSVTKAVEQGTLSGIGNIALVIYDAIMLGMNPYDFNGINLVEIFSETPLSESDSPYTDMYAADIAVAFELDELGRKICSRLAEKYTIGKGTDFWSGYGTSPDDLSVFIIALSNYADDYTEYLEDAFKLLKTFNTEEGYDNYGPNANSTAYALAAAVCAGDKNTADDAYNKLMRFYNKETGGFIGSYDDIISTQDAVFGLGYYLSFAEEDEPAGKPETDVSTTEIPPEEDTTKTETAPETTTEKELSENNGKPAKSPATGAPAAAFSVIAMLAAGSVMIFAKKTRD